VIDKTFRAGEKFRAVRTEAARCSSSTPTAPTRTSWTRRRTSSSRCRRPRRRQAAWTKANETVDLLYIDEQPADIQLPASVELEVTETEPGVRGDTASGGGDKPATLETGAA
jgi:elongation factor P